MIITTFGGAAQADGAATSSTKRASRQWIRFMIGSNQELAGPIENF
jgi:hypothetical protein